MFLAQPLANASPANAPIAAAALQLRLDFVFMRSVKPFCSMIGARVAATVPLSLLLAMILSLAPVGLAAQGGMGGMGGGMGGGRRGGMGGPGMGGARRSPITMIKDNLENNDPIAFLLDRRKPLALTDVQKDSLKSYQKEMQRLQAPLFKAIEGVFAELAPANGAGGRVPGARGGGRNGGGSDGTDPPAGGRGAGMSGMPDTIKVIVTRLSDIQDAYRDRAWTQLSDSQRTTADALLTAKLEAERKKDDEERARRRER